MDKVSVIVIIIVVVLLISGAILLIGKLKKKKNQGAAMNLEVVRTQEPVVDTNSEEDQQLMSFLLGVDAHDQKKCPVCGASNNITSTTCSACNNPLDKGGN